MPNKRNMANTQSASKTETSDAIVCMAKTHDLSNVKSIWNQCIKKKASLVLSGLTMNPNVATICLAHHIDLNYIHELMMKMLQFSSRTIRTCITIRTKLKPNFYRTTPM
jgi:hypothetical protein